MRIISIEEFGKDHWSLLAYIETCCVECLTRMAGGGEIDHNRMRINPSRNPELGCHKTLRGCHSGIRWKDEYSTRLKTFPWESADEEEKAKHRVSGHDDWDCLEDLEQAGFVRLISYVNGFVQITSKGLEMAAAIRAHKANGGFFSNFTPCCGDNK